MVVHTWVAARMACGCIAAMYVCDSGFVWHSFQVLRHSQSWYAVLLHTKKECFKYQIRIQRKRIATLRKESMQIQKRQEARSRLPTNTSSTNPQRMWRGTGTREFKDGRNKEIVPFYALREHSYNQLISHDDSRNLDEAVHYANNNP